MRIVFVLALATSVSVISCGGSADLPLSPSGTLVSGPIVSFDGPGTTFPASLTVPASSAPYTVHFSDGSEQLLSAGEHRLSRGDITLITDRHGNTVYAGG